MRTKMEDKYGVTAQPLVNKKYKGTKDIESENSVSVKSNGKNAYLIFAIIASLCNATG